MFVHFCAFVYVATYPFAGERGEAHGMRLPKEENARSRHQSLFVKNVEKTETCGLRTLIVKGLGVIFTYGEGISTPRVCHKGRQPLVKCANMTSKCFIFLFLRFYVFLCFLSFCGRQGCFPCSYVSSIASKSDLHSSFRTKCWLSCFHLFSQDIF